MSSIKGPAPSTAQFDGSSLRIAIAHSRWNKTVIDALLAGTIAKLKQQGVKESNIVIQSVPGSYELPLACSRYVNRIICVACYKSRVQTHRWLSCAGGRNRNRSTRRSEPDLSSSFVPCIHACTYNIVHAEPAFRCCYCHRRTHQGFDNAF